MRLCSVLQIFLCFSPPPPPPPPLFLPPPPLAPLFHPPPPLLPPRLLPRFIQPVLTHRGDLQTLLPGYCSWFVTFCKKCQPAPEEDFTQVRVTITCAWPSPYQPHYIASPHTTSHHITSITSITSHHFISPHSTSHHLTPPHITSHHLTSPHTTSHHLTPPHIVSKCTLCSS